MIFILICINNIDKSKIKITLENKKTIKFNHINTN